MGTLIKDNKLKRKVLFWKEVVKNADDENIEMLAELLAESEKAKQLLRDKGYGWTGLSLLQTIDEEIPNIKD